MVKILSSVYYKPGATYKVQLHWVANTKSPQSYTHKNREVRRKNVQVGLDLGLVRGLQLVTGVFKIQVGPKYQNKVGFKA